MNISRQQQKDDFVEHDEEKIPELIDQDTSMNGEVNAEHYIRYHDELETMPEENDKDPLMTEQEDVNGVDTIAYTPEESDDEPFNAAIDDTSEDPNIVMGKPVTTAFVSVDVRIQTEKVGCLQVTSQLKEFLNHFPPESKEKAFEQIYKILQVLAYHHCLCHRAYHHYLCHRAYHHCLCHLYHNHYQPHLKLYQYSLKRYQNCHYLCYHTWHSLCQ